MPMASIALTLPVEPESWGLDPPQATKARVRTAANVFVIPLIAVHGNSAITDGLAMGMFSQFQRQMIFPGPEGVSPELLRRAADQVGATELQIPTEDGETLYGWYRNAIQTGQRRVVLYFHGNASSVLAQIELQNLLLTEGWDFVEIHYRGYPGSSGSPSEAGLKKDAFAAWRYATTELGAEPSHVAIHGRSLGGAVAAQLAATVDPGALVLESTFTSIVDLAKKHYWFLPMGRLLEHRFMTRDLAGELSCPILVAHGGADSLIDVQHGRDLARLFHAEQYIEAPRLDHNDVLFAGSFAARYIQFLNDTVPAQP